MTTEPSSTQQASVSAQQTVSGERTENEVVVRLPTFNRFLRAFLPEEAVNHMYAAQREQLLAVRSILDSAINRLEEAQQDRPRRPRRTEIRVE
jgi:hypothetical protein